MISDEYFYNFSKPVLDAAEETELKLLRRVAAVARKVIANPDALVNLSEQQTAILAEWLAYNQQLSDWIESDFPKAYKKGVQIADNTYSGTQLQAGVFSDLPILGQGGAVGTISERAAGVLAELPEHHRAFGILESRFKNEIADTRLPVLRSTMDKIRRFTAEATLAEFREANRATRRSISQQIMRRLSDEGITGVIYQDGRRVGLRSYSELTARTQTANAAREAHMNRLQEYGRDLVLISQHFPTSDLCRPWQGRVYSISGGSTNYPPLQRAVGEGLYHVNCKHSQSGYTPGAKIEEPKLDTAENRRRYKAQQQQRYNERQIRQWKKREATALTDAERQKAKGKISEWQARQREHLDSNPYLRRRYDREQV